MKGLLRETVVGLGRVFGVCRRYLEMLREIVGRG